MSSEDLKPKIYIHVDPELKEHRVRKTSPKSVKVGLRSNFQICLFKEVFLVLVAA